jgi:hypothetical protein
MVRYGLRKEDCPKYAYPSDTADNRKGIAEELI